MNKRQKNRRGDLPITILVIGVFVVTSLALLSFYLSGIDGEETILKVSIIEKTKSFAEEVRFYKNQEINKDPLELMDVFRQGIEIDDVIYLGSLDVGNKDLYYFNTTYSKQNIDLGLFGFGEKKRVFSVEYEFRS